MDRVPYLLRVELPDVPGSLGRLASAIGEAGGDIFAAADGVETIDKKAASKALARLEVDTSGLDHSDRRYLRALIENYGGGPVGLETIAAAIAEARDAVEDMIEPYLLQQGLLKRTPRGRVLSQRAFDHLGLPAPEGAASLF